MIPLLAIAVAQTGSGRRLCAPLLLAVLGASTLPASAAGCEARSGPDRSTVVELYTSEGCSSCPPADRWLSSLRSTNNGPQPLLALAFHVSYWDRLGWADRFASPVYSERQRSVVAAQGGRVVYTPQVIVNGIDWRGWPRLPKAGAAPVDVELSRDGSSVTARIAGRPGGAGMPMQLSGYWVVLEDGHHTDVRAGENAGASLRHDHVVRAYQPVGNWPADREQHWQWRLPEIPDAGRGAATTRRVAFVVTDPTTQRPLQALALAC
ncbi:DUF1223 domain-containing protein [Piscinibacter sakaiensis]|uniref:DUF1223 domain-containing protein n=1 Tax=Piscinibacter sakaiensis TaxID=1547922 RepID=UPI003AAA2D34